MGNINKSIKDKILDEEVPDSEIIQTIESEKKKYSIFRFGFDINWKEPDAYGWSFLILSVLQSREELVEYLLADSDINVNYKSLGSKTAFHLLCNNTCNDSRISILKLLLSHRDINVNIQDEYRRTGLHDACFWGHEAYVKELLLDARVDIIIRSITENTAQDYAKKQAYSRIVNMLKRMGCTSLLRIPNGALLYDITRMIIEEYT